MAASFNAAVEAYGSNRGDFHIATQTEQTGADDEDYSRPRVSEKEYEKTKIHGPKKNNPTL